MRENDSSIVPSWGKHHPHVDFQAARVLSVQPRSVRVRKSAYDKKLWNATARHLSDSRRNNYAFSCCHRCHRDGSSGAGDRYFDFSGQIVNDDNFSVATVLWAVEEKCSGETERRTAPSLQITSRRVTALRQPPR